MLHSSLQLQFSSALNVISFVFKKFVQSLKSRFPVEPPTEGSAAVDDTIQVETVEFIHNYEFIHYTIEINANFINFPDYILVIYLFHS